MLTLLYITTAMILMVTAVVGSHKGVGAFVKRAYGPVLLEEQQHWAEGVQVGAMILTLSLVIIAVGFYALQNPALGYPANYATTVMLGGSAIAMASIIGAVRSLKKLSASFA